MSRCEFRWINEKTLKIIGTIDENFSIDDELLKFKDKVWLDLREVSRINSCGVREWIKAIIKTSSELHYINCSSVIVTQFSMIPEFMGQYGVVESFETQYVCPSCGHEDSSILHVGKDIQAGRESYTRAPAKSCVECGGAMECDHNPELYFSFLSDAV